MPALLRARSSRPKALMVSWTNASTSPGFVTSAFTKMACPPASEILRAVASPSLTLTSDTATLAPSCARAIADVRPKPEAPPVTKATLPENCCVMIRKFRVSLYEYFQSSTFTERLPKVVSVKHRPTYLEEYRSTCCVTAARNQLNPRAG